MNKKLLVLLPIAMLALAGCNNPAEGGGEGGGGEGGGGGGDPTPAEKGLVFDKSVVEQYVEEGKSYPGEAGEIEVGDITFAYSNGTGLKTSERSGGNYFFENGAMQWAKQNHDTKEAGEIRNLDAVDATEIVVFFFSTYATQTSEYLSQVYTGAAEGSYSKVTAKEGTSINGTKVDGAKQVGGGQDRDVYTYTCTYTVPTGHKYFKIAAGNGAFYPKTVTFVK